METSHHADRKSAIRIILSHKQRFYKKTSSQNKRQAKKYEVLNLTLDKGSER